MSVVISGIQQIGIGVEDLDIAWKWYRANFGLDVPIFRDAAPAPFMTKYTGDTVHHRSAVLAVNLMGGSGFEVWQYTSRTPTRPSFEITLGDLGIFSARIKCPDVEAAFSHFEKMGACLSPGIMENPAGHRLFYIRDPFANVFELVESASWFSRIRHVTGGPVGCTIGVTDVDRSLELYRDILGYDQTVYDEQGVFGDYSGIAGGNGRVRRILLTHRSPRGGNFSRLFGTSSIELVCSLERTPKAIYGDRLWGDLGFIHLCFDVRGMEQLEKQLGEKGFPFTVNSKDSFDMGEASGHFTYIEDPAGTLIEFVETHRMPIVKKIGWYLDLRRRSAHKPLPDWMLKTLKFTRHRG